MTPFHIFLFDDYLGSGMQQHPISNHYFCRDCGRIWARTVSDFGEHGTLHVFCPEHDTHFWGAALLCQEIRFFPMQYPRSAWERDFLYLSDPAYRGRFIPYNLPNYPNESNSTS